MRAAVAYGGAPKGPQLALIKRGPHVLIATPEQVLAGGSSLGEGHPQISLRSFFSSAFSVVCDDIAQKQDHKGNAKGQNKETSF